MGKFDVNGSKTNLVAMQKIEDFISVCEYIIEGKPKSKSQINKLRLYARDLVAKMRDVESKTIHRNIVLEMGWDGDNAVDEFEGALWEAINGNVNNLRQACFRVTENDPVGRRRLEGFLDKHFNNEPLYYTEGEEDDPRVGPDNDGPGWVYIVVNPLFDDWVKIGCTKNHRQRIRNFQTYAPKQYQMEYKHHSTEFCYMDEQKVHKELEEQGIEKHREWFKMSIEDARDAINSSLGSRKTSSILDLVE